MLKERAIALQPADLTKVAFDTSLLGVVEAVPLAAGWSGLQAPPSSPASLTYEVFADFLRKCLSGRAHVVAVSCASHH